MEYQKIMLLIVGLLVAVAVYLAVTSPAPVKGAPDSGPAQELLLKSAGFGKGLGGYTYAYSEVSDGYKTSYVIQKDAGLRLARIQNPCRRRASTSSRTTPSFASHIRLTRSAGRYTGTRTSRTTSPSWTLSSSTTP